MKDRFLFTDYYELTMSQAYFDAGKHKEQVYFDLFFRINC